MTLNEFFQKYNGKKVDYDGVYEHQCVDLVKAYIKEVIGGTPWTGNAWEYKNKYDRNRFSWRKNDPWYIPPQGAIVVWNRNVGEGFGHNGIVTSASLMRFVSFDQNWPKGSASVLVNHSYRNVEGFLLERRDDVLTRYNNMVEDLNQLTSRYPAISI